MSRCARTLVLLALGFGTGCRADPEPAVAGTEGTSTGIGDDTSGTTEAADGSTGGVEMCEPPDAPSNEPQWLHLSTGHWPVDIAIEPEDGGYAIAGGSSGGWPDDAICVVRYDATGAVLWRRDGLCRKVALDSTGRWVVLGEVDGGWGVIVLDHDGSQEWSVPLEPDLEAYVDDITVDAEDRIVVLGGLQDDPSTWVVGLDRDGAERWRTTLEGPVGYWAWLGVDAEGRVVVARTLDDVSYYVRLDRIETDGTPSWNHEIHGSVYGGVRVESMAVLDDGAMALLTTEFGLDPAVRSLHLLDTEGSTVWSYGEPDIDWLELKVWEITAGQCGTIALAGEHEELGRTWLTLFGRDGERRWSWMPEVLGPYSGPWAGHHAVAVAVDAEGRVTAVGDTVAGCGSDGNSVFCTTARWAARFVP